MRAVDCRWKGGLGEEPMGEQTESTPCEQLRERLEVMRDPPL